MNTVAIILGTYGIWFYYHKTYGVLSSHGFCSYSFEHSCAQSFSLISGITNRGITTCAGCCSTPSGSIVPLKSVLSNRLSM